MASEGNGKNRVTSTTKCQELYCPVLLLFSAALLHSHAHKHNNAKKNGKKTAHAHQQPATRTHETWKTQRIGGITNIYLVILTF